MSEAKRWERLCDRLALGEELAPGEEAWMQRRAEADPASAAELEFITVFHRWDDRAALPTDSAAQLVRAALAEVDRAEARGEPVGATVAEPEVERPRTWWWWWTLPLGVAAAAAAVVVVILAVGGDDPARSRIARADGEVFVDGEPLSAAEDLAPGATVSVTQGQACLEIEPKIEVCLRSRTTAVLDTADPESLRLEVRRGLAVASLDPLPDGQTFALSHDDVAVTAVGTVFELDVRDPAALVTAVYEGRVWVASSGAGMQLDAGESAVVRDGQIERVDAQPRPAAREADADIEPADPIVESADADVEVEVAPQEGVATELEAPAEADEPEADEPEAIAGAPESEDGVGTAPTHKPASAGRLLAQAQRERQAGRWTAAAQAYAKLYAAHPSSPEARTALVSLGDLQLDRLGKSRAAARSYGRYLAGGGGPLAQEARYGRVRAYRAAGDARAEIGAIEAFLLRHPDSARAGSLRSRLQTLQK